MNNDWQLYNQNYKLIHSFIASKYKCQKIKKKTEV